MPDPFTIKSAISSVLAQLHPSFRPNIQPKSVVVEDDLAYVSFGLGGIVIFNISDPKFPEELCEYSMSCPIKEIFVHRQLIYAACGDDGLRILMRSDDMLMEIGSLVHDKYPAISVSVSGENALVTYGLSGVKSIDITDPSHPMEVGGYAFDKHSAQFVVHIGTDWAYVNFGDGGIRILDVSDPSNPVEMGAYFYKGFLAKSMCVNGAIAYIAYGFGGIVMLDVTNPSAPILIHRHSFIGYPSEFVSIQDNFLYVAVGLGGMRVLELRVDPASLATKLTEISSFCLRDSPIKKLSVTADRLAILCIRKKNGQSHVDIIDVRNPLRIVKLGELRVPRITPCSALCYLV